MLLKKIVAQTPAKFGSSYQNLSKQIYLFAVLGIYSVIKSSLVDCYY